MSFPTTLPHLNGWEQINQTFISVLQRVYLWMAAGLLLTAGVAYFVTNTALVDMISSNPIWFFGLIIAELGLVIGISFGINRMAPTTALVLFFAYAALNGATLSLIFVVYTLSSVALAFVATASLFGAMSLIGYTTKRDLSSMGSYLLMALLGLIIASVVSMVWANSVLDWIITYAGIAIFLGLTIYDTQNIKQMTAAAFQQGDEQTVMRIGIIGALRLYLDFINLFLMLLRAMGRRR